MSNTVKEINYIHANDEIPLLISEKLRESEDLIRYRKDALEAFHYLPVDRDTLFYKYTNFIGLEINSLKPVIPNGDSNKFPIEFIDQINQLKNQTSGLLLENSSGIVYSYLSDALKNEGVIISELRDIIESKPKLINDLLSKRLFRHQNDKLAALNAALVSNRNIIYIPKDIVLEKPIRRIILHDAPNQAFFSEFLIYTEKNSYCEILEELYSNYELEKPSLLSLVEEVHVGSNSQVKLVQVQDLNPVSAFFSNRRVSFENNGKFLSLTHLQGGTLSRATNEIHLDSPGCEAQDLYTMHGTGKQRFDVKSELIHEVENTIASTNARCIMRDHAEGTLRGLINITSKGKNSDSYLKAAGMLNDNGKFNVIPALAIDNNEVRAAHAATVSQIDYEEIFYLLTRGIDEYTARKLIMTSYLEPILAIFKNERIIGLVRDISIQKWLKIFYSKPNIKPFLNTDYFHDKNLLNKLNEAENINRGLK